MKALLRAVRLEREVTPETRIGAGGMRLSGGQQQRLALARQLANLKPLLILDDPFSALDRRTEREVFDELRKKSEKLRSFAEFRIVYMYFRSLMACCGCRTVSCAPRHTRS